MSFDMDGEDWFNGVKKVLIPFEQGDVFRHINYHN